MPTERRSRQRTIVYRAEVPGEAQPHEAQYPSLADALHFACRDLRSGRRSPVAIEEDGVVVYDADKIRLECGEEQQALQDRLLGSPEEAAGS